MAQPVAVQPARRTLRSILMGIGILLIILIVTTTSPKASNTFASPLSTPAPSPLRGIHIGNHVNAEAWNASLLARIDGDEIDGTWPDVIVVLSWQIYNRHRSGSNCRIDSVAIPLSSQANVRDYLQRASGANKRIIIRIMPSPGNFDSGHHLLTTSSSGCNEWANRSYNDIGDEIVKIHEYNAANGITEFGFEPANEPNVEWYRGGADPTPILPSDQVAWSEMDAYFSAVYDYVHMAYPNPTIRVLTPPMSQGAYAELINLDGCGPMGLNDGTSGYEKMSNVFLLGAKNDGYDWHNYWRIGHEGWGECFLANGDHVAYNFPLVMKVNMAPKPRTITEADVAAPSSLGQFGNIGGKDELFGLTTANSLNQFINADLSAEYIAVWNLNVTEANPSSEQNWHEAYCDDRLATDGVRERPWFSLWWTGTPSPPALCNHTFAPAILKPALTPTPTVCPGC